MAENEIENWKKKVEDTVLSVLRRSEDGDYGPYDKWYVALRKRALLKISESEFSEAEASAVNRFYSERREQRECWLKNHKERVQKFLAELNA